MIFLSHNYKDKDIVEPIATRLRDAYGENNVFYDRWTIKPGDNIIDKMNEGLREVNYFFYFISKNSIQSKMVDLEWQVALYKKIKENIKFIPIKIDDSIPPAILLSTLYIDMYNVGFEVGLRQIFDVINNTNTQVINTEFSNIMATLIKYGESNFDIVIKAKYFFEPNTRFFIAYTNKNEDIACKLLSDSVNIESKINNIELNNGITINGQYFQLLRGIEPQFPIRINVSNKKNEKIKDLLLFRAKTENFFNPVPLVLKMEDNDEIKI